MSDHQECNRRAAQADQVATEANNGKRKAHRSDNWTGPGPPSRVARCSPPIGPVLRLRPFRLKLLSLRHSVFPQHFMRLLPNRSGSVTAGQGGSISNHSAVLPFTAPGLFCVFMLFELDSQGAMRGVGTQGDEPGVLWESHSLVHSHPLDQAAPVVRDQVPAYDTLFDFEPCQEAL